MGGSMGGLIKFPRNGARRDAGWNERESAPMATRTDRKVSLITWVDPKTMRDSDDDNDGGGGQAA